MSFVPADCHNIVMDVPATGPDRWLTGQVARAIPADDLKRLRDAGAGAALEFVPWRNVEAQRGAYDWEMVDDMVARCRKAGLRVLLMGPNAAPGWCPNDWYVWDWGRRPVKDQDIRNPMQTYACLSPWNAEAMAYRAEFVALMCSRYHADDVMVINAMSQDGESLLPPAFPCVYDPAALASYRAWVGDSRAAPNIYSDAGRQWLRDSLLPVYIAAQSAVCNAHPARECWSSMHPVFMAEQRWQAGGVVDIAGYWRELLKAVQPASAFHIVFAYFDSNFDGYAPSLVRDLQGLGVGVVTGSEWCEGLARNTPRAIAQGLRALLTAPIHPYTGHEKVEPWMVDAFRESAELFGRGV